MDKPEDWEDYEDQWQQLDEKVLLAQTVVELQRIRLLLEASVGGESGASDDSEGEVVYSCTRCEWTGTESERERHAKGEHNAPPGMVDGLFEEVDE